MKEPKLKPCPFCGGIPIERGKYLPHIIDHKELCYLLYGPGVENPMAIYKDEVELWNKRAK